MNSRRVLVCGACGVVGAASVVRCHARCGVGVCDGCGRDVGEGLLCPACAVRAVPACAPGELVAFTDGSGTVEDLPCGAGVVLFDRDRVVVEASWSIGLGTNNHAELSAVRLALHLSAHHDRWRPLLVCTDSMYAIGVLCATRAPSEDARNGALIRWIRRCMAGRRVRFEHVRGHAGVWGNERADALADRARRRIVARSVARVGAS